MGSRLEEGSVRVEPVARLRGAVSVPGDKSISHRSAMLAALAEGRSVIRHYSAGADCQSTLACLRQLGVKIEQEAEPDGGLLLRVAGRGLPGFVEPVDVLDAGNSGTTTRLISGLLAGHDMTTFLTGDRSLRSRPMLRIVAPLREMGATIVGRQKGDRLPIAIQGGRLRAIEYRTPVASAQIKSAILLAGLLADGPTTVVEPAASRDHTERMLRAQGARVESDGLRVTVHPPARLEPLDMVVPGDFSSAAYWIALACLHPDAEVTVRDVGLNPGRIGLLEVLREMGAQLSVSRERLEGGEPIGDVTARSSSLRGVEVGGDLIPALIDEVPLLAVLAAFAEGTTRIRDAQELRVKESDRLATTTEGLRALGAQVEELSDGLEIQGGRRPRAGVVQSYGDHRLAMSLAIAGFAGEGATVEGAGAVDVSYPSFWSCAESLGARMER